MTGVVAAPPVLDGGQVKALRELISLRFSLDELEILTREDLNRQLSTLVDVRKPYDKIVFDLIERLDQDGFLTKLAAAVETRKPFLKPQVRMILGNEEP